MLQRQLRQLHRGASTVVCGQATLEPSARHEKAICDKMIEQLWSSASVVAAAGHTGFHWPYRIPGIAASVLWSGTAAKVPTVTCHSIGTDTDNTSHVRESPRPVENATTNAHRDRPPRRVTAHPAWTAAGLRHGLAPIVSGRGPKGTARHSGNVNHSADVGALWRFAISAPILLWPSMISRRAGQPSRPRPRAATRTRRAASPGPRADRSG